MGTGELNIPFGSLNEWNYQNHSKYYKDSCSEIKGSAGEFFPRNLSITDGLDIFFTDVCRPLSFYYEKEHVYKNIDIYKFIGTENTFDNGINIQHFFKIILLHTSHRLFSIND